jgi:hypothetical protein
MQLTAGSGASKLGAGRFHIINEAPHKILRQKRRIRSDADDKRAVGTIVSGPIEPRQNSGKRTSEIGNAVGDDRQAEMGEPRGLAISVQHKRIDLRPQPIDHVLQQWPAGKRPKTFVASSHAA